MKIKIRTLFFVSAVVFGIVACIVGLSQSSQSETGITSIEYDSTTDSKIMASDDELFNKLVDNQVSDKAKKVMFDLKPQIDNASCNELAVMLDENPNWTLAPYMKSKLASRDC